MTIARDYGSLVGFEEKALAESDDVWTITGYGSIFNNTDLGNDAVVPGAFAKSLRDHGLPLLLFNHKMEDAPIGTIIDAKEDKRGLWFKAELPKDDSFVAGRIVPQLKRRGLKGCSIGYRATKSERRKEDGVRLLKECRLWEISVVNNPMNPAANVEHIKGLTSFADLAIDRDAKGWDAAAALKRITEKFAGSDELKSAFLYFDEDAGEPDAKWLIADVDESGCIKANHMALFHASAVLYGGSSKGDLLPEGAEDAVKGHLDRYFSRLNLESPSKSLSVAEFEALNEGEREARLRGLGVSRQLAKKLLSTGQRDADRKEAQRDVGLPEDAKGLLTALAAIGDIAAAIKRST